MGSWGEISPLLIRSITPLITGRGHLVRYTYVMCNNVAIFVELGRSSLQQISPELIV